MACLLLIVECIGLGIKVHLNLDLNDLIKVLGIYFISLIKVIQVNLCQILPCNKLKTSSIPITELDNG